MSSGNCLHDRSRTFSSRPPDEDGWIAVTEHCSACSATKITRVRLSHEDDAHWQVWREPWRKPAA